LDPSRDDRKSLAGYRVYVHDLDSAPWSVVCVVRERNLGRGFAAASAGYGVFALALALSALVLQALVRAHFVAPALALVKHIRMEATAGPMPIPHVPASWKPWFREISDLLPLKALATNLPGAVFQFVRRRDGRAEIPFVSQGIGDLIGVPAEEIERSVETVFRLFAAEDVHAMAAAGAEAAAEMRPVQHEYPVVTQTGERKWVHMIARPRAGDDGDIVWDGIALDVTARRLAEEERERLLAELREALGQIKTLTGLLPMCSSCKRVRDDSGYWHEVECYIREHSDAEPTHGLCPECTRKLYPDYSRAT